MMPADEPVETRRKRAKIVSACSECRRKKTKCNGEQPCRNCQKSSVPCVYPSTSHADDRRNAPSKAALEAIEERLKTIEDMLKTILQAHLPLGDLDPMAVNNFLNKDRPGSPTVSSSIPSPPQPTALIRPSTPHDLKLPSIHDLSGPSAYHHQQHHPHPSHHQLPAKHEHHDLPPLALHDYSLYPSSYKNPPSNSCKSSSDNEEYTLQPIKKRKR
ncbi:uncharacterized protein BYT42DRAFT_585320 [Radiomyces spectabilis]|uniref:uncharacterized protein n=1 Tax=Radiomyces spectabilis TaxID=64574 RepID=UPI00221E9376|nr:uncharacterized protein BYT42DRAFT_585320 [Radiomyces spectabilis]KAI8368113.1 hypothetical protein BYT42DRAFT_585320 [Radiomyces spectabilis]